jgi:hypothetical protein
VVSRKIHRLRRPPRKIRLPSAVSAPACRREIKSRVSGPRHEPGFQSRGAHPPRVWLDAPRVQHAAPPAVPRRPALFHAPRVLREGAEDGTRGRVRIQLRSSG